MMVHEWEQKRVSQMSYDAKGTVFKSDIQESHTVA